LVVKELRGLDSERGTVVWGGSTDVERLGE
jgi:hypothetical protein